MPSSITFVLAILATASLCNASPAILTTCTDIVIPVTASANSVVIPVTTPAAFSTTSGTWNISALYCEPGGIGKTHDALQILVHGITYTSRYWTGGVAEAQPGLNPNSWVNFATTAGFATLAIDRLGNGRSDHPDPTILQVPLNVEIIHQIVTKARAGNLPTPIKRSWSRIVYVGHSAGSIVGNALNVQYPLDVDATILTGLTERFNLAILGPVLSQLAPASTVDPSRFGTLPDGYWAFNNKTAFMQGFYYPNNFDPKLADRDYATRGTVGDGELQSTFVFPVTSATGYTRPVLDITAEHDGLFCQNLDVQLLPMPYPTYNCGPYKGGNVDTARSLYPSAAYTYLTPSTSGHCWQNHYQATDMFTAAHVWLAGNGF